MRPDRVARQRRIWSMAKRRNSLEVPRQDRSRPAITEGYLAMFDRSATMARVGFDIDGFERWRNAAVDRIRGVGR